MRGSHGTRWRFGTRARRRLAFAAVLLWIGACQAPQEPPPPAAPSALELTGRWIVVGHQIPGVSAMNDSEATTWHGRRVHLGLRWASTGGEQCDAPTYHARVVAAEAFLATEFNLSAGRVPSLAASEAVTVLDVSCDGAPWVALGGRVMAIDVDHALTPWDGVFFALERDTVFRAQGQEPFWHIEIAGGTPIRFVRLGEDDLLLPLPVPTTDAVSGARIYHAATDAHELRVAIAPLPCTDSMSGVSFETTVSVTLDGQVYSGCGVALP